MADQCDHDRRKFLGATVLSIATAELALRRLAHGQPRSAPPAELPSNIGSARTTLTLRSLPRVCLSVSRRMMGGHSVGVGQKISAGGG